jgi:hypothetical protein
MADRSERYADADYGWVRLTDAVRRLRRGLRDVRDRMACRGRQLRDVSFAGMAGGDRVALVMIIEPMPMVI